ncbi:hypothetical protein KSP39_PZI016503 [Platanthera zijinensis]|uniref:RING-type E3 ubiquitin transferase n=1 Tax=Platanthera zijinensis TaxID=2320716 RepID=A0AAP0G1F0_9ASPA
MAVGAEVVRTPCKHQFHGDCLRKWFEKAGSCPLCRLNFDQSLRSRPFYSSQFGLQFT